MTPKGRVVLRAVRFGAVRGLLWGGGYGFAYGILWIWIPPVTLFCIAVGGASGVVGGVVGAIVGSRGSTRLWWSVSGAVGGAVAGLALMAVDFLFIGDPDLMRGTSWVILVGVPAVIGAFVGPGGVSLLTESDQVLVG